MGRDICDDARKAFAAYHGLGKEIVDKLIAELEWYRQKPNEECDSKCEYGKRGDPKGCFCGRAEWDSKAPAHLR